MFSLRDLMAVLIIASVVAVLAFHLSRPFGGNHRGVACANNLAQLFKMQANYRAQFGHGDLPTETGGDFWLKLTRTEPPLIDHTLRDIFHCRVRDRGGRCARECDYRGPNSNVNHFGDRDVVGADLVGNHAADGNVLRMSGDVFTVAPDDPFWIRASSHTKP